MHTKLMHSDAMDLWPNITQMIKPNPVYNIEIVPYLLYV